MRAIVTVVGKDRVGIIANVCNLLAKYQVNVLDISQTVLQGYFTMIMIVDIQKLVCPFNDFVDRMAALGKKDGLEIHVMHEDIFNSMHRI